MFFKKLITIFLLYIFVLAQPASVLAKSKPKNENLMQTGSRYIFHGHAEINQGAPEHENIFTGETGKVDEGTKIEMTVSNVISSTYNLEGDEFFAEVTKDVESEEGIVIPAGSVAHGKVSGIEDSKRMGRDGHVTLEFDYIVTPDGREIPIEGKMTTKRHPAASVAKVILEDTAYTLGGGLAGGYAALRLLGVGAAVSSNGATLGVGAGLGAVAGAGIALTRKGQEVLLAPGDEIKVKVLGSMELPVISDEAFKEEEKKFDGLEVRIVNYELEKDPFGDPNTITLSLVVVNKTKKTFSSFDMALINDYRSVYYASPFGNTEMWFTRIRPFTRIAGKLSFSVDNPKRKHWLVFYDNRTRKPLAKISVDNAKRDIKRRKKKKR